MIFKLTLKRNFFFYYFPVVGNVVLAILLVIGMGYLKQIKYPLGYIYLFLIILSAMSIFIIIPMTFIYFKFLKYSKSVVFEVNGNQCFFCDKSNETLSFYKSEITKVILYKLPSAYKKDFSSMFISNFYLYRIVLNNGKHVDIPSLICEKIDLVLNNKIIEEKKSFYSFVFKEW